MIRFYHVLYIYPHSKEKNSKKLIKMYSKRSFLILVHLYCFFFFKYILFNKTSMTLI